MKFKLLLALLSILLVSCEGKKPPKVATPDPYEKYNITRSNTLIDCNRGKFNDGKLTKIIIHNKDERLQNINIRSCEIRGNIRMYGLGINGEALNVKLSSNNRDHTQKAQKAAPTNITISNVKIWEDGDIPIYISPGVTNVTIENSEFTGKSNSVAIYLDAESANNKITGNIFDISTRREVIAMDGSAHNLIEKNEFKKVSKGGIYLYRNCGEGGTARHQTPSDNKIIGNQFNLSNLQSESYAIWLSSRNGNRNYCTMDSRIKYGSGTNDLDFASHNLIQGNIFQGSNRTVMDNGVNNIIK